jgi:hypothetical protein
MIPGMEIFNWPLDCSDDRRNSALNRRKAYTPYSDASDPSFILVRKVGLSRSPGLIRVQRRTAQQGEERSD